MGWEGRTAATQLTNITTSAKTFALEPESTSGEDITAHIEVAIDGSTDNAIVKVFGGQGATPTFSEKPILQFTIDNADDLTRIPFILSGWRHYQISVERDGSTDTIDTADLWGEGDGVNL